VGKKNAPALSVVMLEKALPLVAGNTLLVSQTSFFLGLAYLYKLQAMDLAAVMKNKDCAGINELATIAKNGKAAIIAGASVQPATAQQLTTIFTNLEKTPPQARAAWKCR
jgi:hypothetical protein